MFSPHYALIYISSKYTDTFNDLRSIVFKFLVWQCNIGCQALEAHKYTKWQYGYEALRVVSYFHKHRNRITEIAQFMWKYLFIRSIMSRVFTSTCYVSTAESHTFTQCSFFQVSSQEIFRTWFNSRGLHIGSRRQKAAKVACKESKHARQSCECKEREMRWNGDYETATTNVTSESEIEIEWKYEINEVSRRSLPPTTEHGSLKSQFKSIEHFLKLFLVQHFLVMLFTDRRQRHITIFTTYRCCFRWRRHRVAST